MKQKGSRKINLDVRKKKVISHQGKENLTITERIESSQKTTEEAACTADRRAANVARNQLHIHDVNSLQSHCRESSFKILLQLLSDQSVFLKW